jgi:phospholipid-binding lipoprotein MlaA
MGPRPARWLALALVIGLASVPARAQEDTNDPLEPFNRAVFTVNDTLDQMLLEPIAMGYRWAVPDLAKEGVSNILDNLRGPVTLLHDLLQGEWDRARITGGRFMLNSIVGLGGIFDVATWAGMEDGHDEDLGQTLAVWGVPDGPYLMLPLLGPSNPRDAIGRVGDLFLDPFSIIDTPTEFAVSRVAGTVVTFREQNLDTIAELRRSSLDFYATTRTLGRQVRASEIRNGQPADFGDIYDESLYDEPLDDPAGDPFADPAAPEGGQ